MDMKTFYVKTDGDLIEVLAEYCSTSADGVKLYIGEDVIAWFRRWDWWKQESETEAATEQNLGCKVTVYSKPESKYADTMVYRNITEIHYNYKGETGIRIALESDVHSNGITLPFAEIKEFETALETEVANGLVD